MTKPAKVLHLLAKANEDLAVHKDLLWMAPVDHLLRGFVFERTGDKGQYFFWRVVMPLYRERPILALNYSERIGSGTYRFNVGDQTAEDVAAEIQSAMEKSDSLATLRAVNAPRDFLRSLKYVTASVALDCRTAMDVAFSYWLEGDRRMCGQILRSANAEPISYQYEAALSSEIDAVLEDIGKSPRAVDERLMRWESRNKAQLLGIDDITGP